MNIRIFMYAIRALSVNRWGISKFYILIFFLDIPPSSVYTCNFELSSSFTRSYLQYMVVCKVYMVFTCMRRLQLLQFDSFHCFQIVGSIIKTCGAVTWLRPPAVSLAEPTTVSGCWPKPRNKADSQRFSICYVRGTSTCI